MGMRTRLAPHQSVRPRSCWASPLRRREAINGFLFIGPWLVGMVVFVLAPFVAGLYFSLTEFNGITVPNWIGLENYHRLLVKDEKFWLAVGNTVWYVGVSVVPRITLALMLALLLNQKIKGITVFRTLFYIPSIVPSVASIALFIFILHDRFGLLNESLYRWFGIIGPHWLTSTEWSKPSLVIWSVWGLGGSMIIYLAGLQGVPGSLYEAASIDGAGALHRFSRITLPLISPTIFFVLVMGIIGSFQIFTPVFLLGQSSYGEAPAGPLNSLLFWVVYIYNCGFHYFNMGYASALAWVLFVVLVILTLLQLRLSKRWVYYEGELRK